MIKKNIIIIAIASKSEIYDEIVKCYWNPMIDYCNKNLPNIKIFLLYNNYPEYLNVNPDNLININQEETYIPGILDKTISAFQFINENYQYQSVIRTNVSSFIILKQIIEISKELHQKKEFLYAGKRNIAMYKRIHYISGALFWINKRTLEFILNNQNSLNKNLIDDLSIGELITTNPDIKMIFLKRCDALCNLQENKKIPGLIKRILNQNHFHLRIKSKERQRDIVKFKVLTTFFYS